MRWLGVPLLLVAVAADADDVSDAKRWALILDPATPQDVRMNAVSNFQLPMKYVEIVMNAELKLRQEAARDPKPWHANVLEALDRLDVSTGYRPGIDLLGKMPCTSEMDEQLMLRNLERFEMTPELYGVLRNLVLRHDGKLTTPRQWFGWGDYRREDTVNWWASQAFVVEFAPETDREMLQRLEEGAAAERDAIAKARERMLGEELCR